MTHKIKYRLILECQTDTVDPPIRLKRLLKFALRVCRLRCVEAKELEPTK